MSDEETDFLKSMFEEWISEEKPNWSIYMRECKYVGRTTLERFESFCAGFKAAQKFMKEEIEAAIEQAPEYIYYEWLSTAGAKREVEAGALYAGLTGGVPEQYKAGLNQLESRNYVAIWRQG